MATFDRQFVVTLKGRDYVLYAGVLDAATKAGLRSLTTHVEQIPSADNGNLAVVTARVEFDDGRVFEDVGDCSPQSTTPHLAVAALRLASTRAKGRVLRDGINATAELFDDLSPQWERSTVGGADRPQATPRKAAPSRPQTKPPTTNGREETGPAPVPAVPPAGHATNPTGPVRCAAEGCGKPTTSKYANDGLQSFGMPLCRACFEAMATRTRR